MGQLRPIAGERCGAKLDDNDVEGDGPLALDYILAHGGGGHFRMGAVRSLIDDGRLVLVSDSPEFSYTCYMVHSTKADESVMGRFRLGLTAAAEAPV